MDKLTALDVIEAAERAGGKATLYGPYANGKYGAGIGNLPDVGRFMRALAHVGVQGTITYSAGIGWKVESPHV